MGFSVQKGKQKAPSLFQAFPVVGLQSLQEALFPELVYGCSEPALAVGGEGTRECLLTPRVSQRGIPHPHLSGLEILPLP